jgi:hypothetical protein
MFALGSQTNRFVKEMHHHRQAYQILLVSSLIISTFDVLMLKFAFKVKAINSFCGSATMFRVTVFITTKQIFQPSSFNSEFSDHFHFAVGFLDGSSSLL